MEIEKVLRAHGVSAVFISLRWGSTARLGRGVAFCESRRPLGLRVSKHSLGLRNNKRPVGLRVARRSVASRVSRRSLGSRVSNLRRIPGGDAGV